jgi:hypothetical protein
MPEPQLLKRTFILPVDASDHELKAMIDSCKGHINTETSLCEADTLEVDAPHKLCMMYTFYFGEVDKSLDRKHYLEGVL